MNIVQRMLRRNPVQVAGLGDLNVRELIQSEERFFSGIRRRVVVPSAGKFF